MSLYLSGLNHTLLYYYFTTCDFFTPALRGGFHLGLIDNKCPQLFNIFLSILAILNNTVICIVWNLPLISSFFILLCKPLGIISSPPRTTESPITFMLHRYFSSVARSKYLRFFFFCFLSFSSDYP